MSDYTDALAKLEAFNASLHKDTDGSITGLVHSYEMPTRDLVEILVPLFKALAPPPK